MNQLARTIDVGLIPGARVERHDVPELDGVQFVVTFPNGFGASVVNHRGSYGVEMAVLDREGEITMDTPVASDVLPWLTAPELMDALHAVAAL
jgi:hypothetical protein